MISTAGDATLHEQYGHLVNGAFSLGAATAGLELSKATWTGPVSNDVVDVAFKQSIAANDALRTGTYAKTLTFTLATTTP